MVVYSFPALQVNTAGLATSAKQDSQTAILTTIDAGIPAALGQTTMLASMPVTLASDQSAVPVSGPLTDVQIRATALPVSGPLTDVQIRATALPVSGPLTDAQIRATALPVSGPLTDVQLRATAVPVSAASLPLPAGAATETTLAALNTKVTAVNTGAVTISTALPTGANVIGSLTANQSVNAAQINGVAPLMGNGVTGTGSLRVTLASDTASNTNALLVNVQKSATATLANIASSATSVTLQLANSARKSWTIHNDSSSVLYVKFGATASATSYTVKLIADAYYELPDSSIYTGVIDGIWASAAGSARVTELS